MPWRNYLAIIVLRIMLLRASHFPFVQASARYRCEYSVSWQESEFLANKGD